MNLTEIKYVYIRNYSISQIQVFIGNYRNFLQLNQGYDIIKDVWIFIYVLFIH